MEKSLAGNVELVSGVTRGAGRGIAVQLGAAGTTVYVTGRTTRSEPIEETAALMDEAGGRGIAVQVDHIVPSGQLAKIYGFTDLDGSQPDAWRYVAELQDAGKPADVTGYR
jgi:NAD(P)-dependent dehydrogenase (short-subunit alcohol dehydrogenase family)